MKITFLGAAQEVTGSKYLVEQAGTKILVDCGLEQGLHDSKNQQKKLLIDPKLIDAVVLTHAHIDHTGYIPLLVKNGFQGKIYCSRATYDLCKILLVDSGSIQEDDAKKSNTLPLYTQQEAQRSLRFFQVVNYTTPITIGALQVQLLSSEHIIGSAFVVVTDGRNTLTFSGDLSGFNQLLMKSPMLLKQTDYLVVESTYGDRLHEKIDFLKFLADIIHATVTKKGTLIIPAFAVGRAQTILYCLYKLKQQGSIPHVPIFLDSPMAVKASKLLCDFPQELRISAAECNDMLQQATFINSSLESKAVDTMPSPKIIVTSSGMAEGGRVLHHLKHFIFDPKNTVLFVGYQAEGTHGYDLTHGAKTITIDGKIYNVQADVKNLDSFSAHADWQEILQWLSGFENKPKKIFITHGQKESAESLKAKIEERFGWSVVVSQYSESFELD